MANFLRENSWEGASNEVKQHSRPKRTVCYFKVLKLDELLYLSC